MGIFERFGKKENQKIEGDIGFYGLADWWLSEFTEEERQHIVDRYKPMGRDSSSYNLIKGKIYDGGSDYPVTMFLSGLAGWFRTKEDSHIAKRINKKMQELGRLHTVDKPGYYQGRHYTTYWEEIKELKRSNSTDELERLLLGLIDAVEAESKLTGYALAHGYTEQLAILYRKQGEYFKEIKILSRYIRATQQADNHQIGAGIVERLEKAKLLADKASQKKG